MDFASMPKEDLLDLLAHCGLDVPEGLPRAIVVRGTEMLEPLCAAVADPDAWRVPDLGDPAGWLPVHAMHLLGGIGDPAAAEALLCPLRRDDYADFYTEDGPGIFAHLGPGAVPVLRGFVLTETEDVDEFALTIAVQGLMGMSLLYPDHARVGAETARELIVLCSSSGIPVPSIVACDLATVAEPADLELLKRTYEADEWSDYWGLRWPAVERAQATGPSETDIEHWTRDPMSYFAARHLEYLRSANAPVPASESARPSRPAAPRPQTLSLFDDGPGIPAAPPPKPGRNEPCPCGSGKKYKKCCGR